MFYSRLLYISFYYNACQEFTLSYWPINAHFVLFALVFQYSDSPTSCHPVLYFTSSCTTLQIKRYCFLHWCKYLDPIAIDNISSRGLSICYFTNSFSDFVGVIGIFCWLLPCIFSATFWIQSALSLGFYMLLSYSRPEFPSFFTYPLLYSLHVTLHPILDQTLTVYIGILFCRYCFILFLYRFRVAAFSLIHCLSFSAALLYPFLFWLNTTDDPTLSSDFPFPPFLSPIFQ